MEARQRVVLVAEDERLILDLVVTILGAAGFEVVAVENGRQAVERFRPATYAIVLLDVRMPGGDGIEALRAIHALETDVPILLMSGDAVEAAAGMTAGARGIIQKPFNRRGLLEQVEGALSGAKPP